MSEREQVISLLKQCLEDWPYAATRVPTIMNRIKNAVAILEKSEVPDANVGKWTTKRTQEHDGEWYCSECGYEPVVMSDDMKYCPGCGRKMTMPEQPKEGNKGG